MSKAKSFILMTLTMTLCLLLLLSGCEKTYQPESELNIDLEDYEEEIAGYLFGGFLYNSQLDHVTQEESDYQELRQEATDVMLESVNLCAKESLKVNEGLRQVEMILLQQLDMISLEDTQLTYGETVVDTIFNFRVLLDTTEQEIMSYSASEGMDDLAKIQMDNGLMNSVSYMVELENQYIAYLIEQTAYITYMAEEMGSNEDVTVAVRTAYTSLVESSFDEMLFHYDVAGSAFHVIESADYYASAYFLDGAKERLEIIEELESKGKIKLDRSMDIEDFLEAVDYLEDHREEPEDLLEVQGKIMLVSRQDDDLDNANNLLEAVDRDVVNDAGDTRSFDQAISAYQKETMEPLSGATHSNMYQSPPSVSAKKLTQVSAGDKLAAAWFAGDVKDKLDLVRQCEEGYNAQYAMLIKTISAALIDHKDKFTEKQLENIQQLIGEKLEEQLGSQKEQFVEMILTTQEEDLILQFLEWKNQTEHFDSFDFNTEHLAELIHTIGFEVEEEAIVVEEPAVEPESEIDVYLGASDYEPYVGQEVLYDLSHSMDVAYYLWRGLDEEWVQSNSNTFIETYHSTGEKTVYVRCYDSDGKQLFETSCGVMVLSEEIDEPSVNTTSNVMTFILTPEEMEGLKSNVGLEAIVRTVFGESLPDPLSDKEPDRYLFDEYKWIDVRYNNEQISLVTAYDYSEAEDVTYVSAVSFDSTGDTFVRLMYQKTVHDQKRGETFSSFSANKSFYTSWYAEFYSDTGMMEVVMHLDSDSKVDEPIVSYYPDGHIHGIREITYTSDTEARAVVSIYEKSDGDYYLSLYYEAKVTFYTNGLHGSTATLYDWNKSGGVYDGFYYDYWSTGEYYAIATHVDGKREGVYLEYYDDGRPRTEGFYVNGEMDGVWTSYSNETGIAYTTTYSMGEMLD